MKKVLTTLALTIITLMAIGYSYACTNGGISINCYCNCDLSFTKVTYWDNEIQKDVANVNAYITCDKDTINVIITNGYPCYMAYINYTIKNTGNYQIQFTNLTIINDNPEALDITTTNHTSTTLNPCQTISGTTTVHILQPAKQNWTYTFQIKIGAQCKTKGYPRTIGFWKNQFDKALCKPGKPQIDPDTLENYLNQISAQSPIYEFTGTRTQKFQNASKILSSPWYTIEAKLKAQLLALWLNYVAGWTEGYKYKGMTAWQIIQGSENALLNHQTNKYEYWKEMCDGFNNLGG
jgi:hypothetical protein